ncbi:hypothetical protein M885DRAFT_454122 [Pelagophyceae sp. CCMP2097]|nr:hypothetical protein M885DRAFT_454122 [Pelagophyceae sp. CCMP2097]
MSKEDEAYGAAIHWLDEDGGWYKFDGAEWKGYRAAAAGAAQHLEVCAPKPAEWRPWTRLLDASSAPHMKWFVGARTNATFTAVDVGALTHPGAVAYEHVSAIDDEVTSITRAELLVAVCAAAQALAHAGPRAFFHARVGLEHAIYALACARLAFPYTCSSLDATDGALDHRLADFAPTVCVVSADGEVSGPGAAPASRARAALRRVGAEGVAVHQIRAGDAARLSVGPLRYATPVSVDDSRPLCVVYTSGSTGKPKGAVHTHGGYTATLARTNSYVFQAKESDVFLVVATFAWITGQSYMLMAPLLARCKSVLMEGSPARGRVGHDGLRWARVARERGVTVLKLASAFARHAMVDPGRRAALAALDLPATLRTGTFCAEPCSDDVLKWARGALCSNFFVSYWSTEHGSVVLTRRHTRDFYKDCGTKLYAVPWVAADLLAGEGNLRGVVLTRPYAGLCRTVWGNVAGYEKANWRGDAERFKEAYFPDEGGCGEGDAGGVRLGFVQGDAAVRHGDGGFTFFGRSDEVLNVSGVRVGVEELEQCAYAAGGEGIVRLAVVGAPAALEGEVPVAFVVASAAVRHGAVLAALRSAARTQLGAHAETRAVLFVSDLPFTVTGKPCRALLRAALRGEPRLEAGASARSVRNAAAYAACCDVADTWRALSAQKTVAGAKAWANAGFDGHVVLGSPLLPGTGWLDLVRRAYVRPETPDVFLTHVEFLRQVL